MNVYVFLFEQKAVVLNRKVDAANRALRIGNFLNIKSTQLIKDIKKI